MKCIVFNLLFLGLGLGQLMSVKTNSIITIAHRGASILEPENTLAAFEKAISLGVNAIELDVYRCASGELVVIHDKTIDRTTNGTGYVEKLTLQELKNLDAGNGQTIPTLEEIFTLVNRRCIINIELKGAHTEENVADLIKKYVVRHNWHYSDFLVSSFDHHRIIHFNSILPECELAALIAHKPLDYAAITKSLPVTTLGVYSDYIDRTFVEDAHKRSIKIYAYVVNEYDEIDKLIDLGIDGIFTDYPDRLVAACTEEKK